MTHSRIFPLVKQCSLLICIPPLFTTTSCLLLRFLNLSFLRSSIFFFCTLQTLSTYCLHIVHFPHSLIVFYLLPVGHIKTTGQHSFTFDSTSRGEFWSVVSKTRLLLACSWIGYYILKKYMADSTSLKHILYL